jgi:hypothetical protein
MSCIGAKRTSAKRLTSAKCQQQRKSPTLDQSPSSRRATSGTRGDQLLHQFRVMAKLEFWRPQRGVSSTSNSHIFIPGDIPFISFLLRELGLVVGPCTPTPCTSNETFTLPAFFELEVTGTLSPPKGLLRILCNCRMRQAQCLRGSISPF